MIVRNYLETQPVYKSSHDGAGKAREVNLFRQEDFDTPLRFIIYTVLEPGNSIGYHPHGQNEEVYVILEGSGLMTVNDEERDAKSGDVFVNKAGWSYGLLNNSDAPLKILVFEVDGSQSQP